jgi:hypothetical protein
MKEMLLHALLNALHVYLPQIERYIGANPVILLVVVLLFLVGGAIKFAVEEIQSNDTNPAILPEYRGSTKTNAVLSLVFGGISLLVAAIVFGPAAIACGAVAGSRGNPAGWVGLAFGVAGLIGFVFLISSS